MFAWCMITFSRNGWLIHINFVFLYVKWLLHNKQQPLSSFFRFQFSGHSLSFTVHPSGAPKAETSVKSLFL